MKYQLLACALLSVAGPLTAGQLSAAGMSHSMSSASIIRLVARHYGESRPHVIHVQTTQTDPTPHETMYVIQLSGHFRRGPARARQLFFSALADRWYVWGVQGYDARHHLVWLDYTLPRPHVH